MIVTLQFDVVAPDSELARENLSYVVLEKEILLPMAPFPGMDILLPSLVLETDPRVDTLEQTMASFSRPTSIFTIQKISCILGEFPAIEVYAECVKCLREKHDCDLV